MLLEGHWSANIHMKMLFSVCCLNNQGHFCKVILLVIICACLFLSWMAEHNVFLKFWIILALLIHWLSPFPLTPKWGTPPKKSYVNPNISLGERTGERGISEHYYVSVAKSFRLYFALIRWAWFPDTWISCIIQQACFSCTCLGH